LSAAFRALLFWALIPCYLYLYPSGGEYEQAWLNAAIAHLKVMRAHCDDPDLCGVIDYTISRYSRLGRFDVSVQWTVNTTPRHRALAYNCPWLPGLTLDYDLLQYYSVEYGAVILCHEALHDYFPYFGHAHVTPREEKLHALSRTVRSL
jgi:hypothetical protein